MKDLNNEKTIKTLYELYAEQNDLQIQIKSIKEIHSSELSEKKTTN